MKRKLDALAGPSLEDEFERLLAVEVPTDGAGLLDVLPPPAPAERGRVGALGWLQAQFSLEPVEYWVLVAAAAPGVSRRAAELYASRSTPAGRPQLTFGLLEVFLGAAAVERADLATALLPGSRLVDAGLVLVGRHPQTLGIDGINLSRRALDFLLRPSLSVDPLLTGYATLRRRAPKESALIVAESTRSALARVGEALSAAGLRVPPRVVLTGAVGAGKRTWSSVLAMAMDQATLEIHTNRIPAAHFGDGLTSLLREARLLGAIPVLTGCEALLGPPELSEDGHDHHAARREALHDRLRRHRRTVFVTSRKRLRAGELEEQLGSAAHVVHLPVPDSAVRRALWDRFLPPAFRADDLDLDAVVAKYALPPGKVERVADHAVGKAMQAGSSPAVNRATLEAAVREHVNPKLKSLARHVPATASWNDLILDEEHLILLHTLVHHYRHRERVHEAWGIGRTTRNRGVCALLSGPPGTGKTLAANVIAAELGMELFQVDLASLVSKYIGETEKNLAVIFEEAEAAGALILFDEADSLFGKRTQVRSSTDRYANMGTNYLLQRVEAFDGVVILTTNLLSAIDEAFLRRMQFNIAFSAPDTDMRARLWEVLLPDTLPISGDIDFDKLAREFDMSGGLIRNAVVQAAFFAAELDCEVDQDLLYFSSTLEMRSQGQLVRSIDVKAFFDEYRRRTR